MFVKFVKISVNLKNSKHYFRLFGENEIQQKFARVNLIVHFTWTYFALVIHVRIIDCLKVEGSVHFNNTLFQDLIGTTIKDLCHPHDLSKLTAHLNDTLQVGQSISDVYRLRVSPDKFLNIQTKSRLFKANVMNTHTTDFIMATNSIIG